MLLAVALASAAAAAPPPANLLLVTIDTLRADRVGAYGYAPARRPRSTGWRGRACWSRTPSCRCRRRGRRTPRSSRAGCPTSTASATTSRRRSTRGCPTLATRPEAAGATPRAASSGAYPVSRASGLDQRLRRFDDPFGGRGERAPRATRAPSAARREVVDDALALAGQPAHARPSSPGCTSSTRTRPTSRPRPSARGSRRALRRRGGLRRRAGRPAARRGSTQPGQRDTHARGRHLRPRRGARATTARTSTCSSSTTPRCASRCCCAGPGRLPAARARRADSSAASTCCRPLLELPGVPRRPTSGASRAADAARRAAASPTTSRTRRASTGSLHFGWAPLRALRAEGWKYIDAPRAELYRVAEDPGRDAQPHGRPRAGGARDAAAARARSTGAWPRAAPAGAGPGGGRAAGRARLRGRRLLPAAPPRAPTRRTRSQEFQGHRREFQEALRALPASATSTAPSASSRGWRAPPQRNGQVRRAALLQRRLLPRPQPARAAPLRGGRARRSTRAVALEPESVPAYVSSRRRRPARAGPPEALATVDAAWRARPTTPSCTRLEGPPAARAPGDARRGARQPRTRARARPRQRPRARRPGGALSQRRASSTRRARRPRRRCASLRARPRRHVARGLVEGARAARPRPAQAFRAALEHEPDHPDALFFLASIELRAGRPAAAVPLLERLLKRAPGYPGARAPLALARRQAAAAGAGGPAGRLGPPAPAARRRPLPGPGRGAPRGVGRGLRGARAGRVRGLFVGARRRPRLWFPADLAEPLRTAAAASGPASSAPCSRQRPATSC